MIVIDMKSTSCAPPIALVTLPVKKLREASVNDTVSMKLPATGVLANPALPPDKSRVPNTAKPPTREGASLKFLPKNSAFPL